MKTATDSLLSSASTQPETAGVSKVAVATALLLALYAPVQATTTVYDNMVPASTINNGRENDPDHPGLLHADGFQFASTTTFNLVTWHGLRTGNPDQFRLEIYNIVGPVPAMTPFISLSLSPMTRLDSGYRDPYRSVIYSYSAQFPDQTLGAGSYALSIINETIGDTQWIWATGNNRNGSFMIQAGDTAWRDSTGGPEFAFTLGVVPEASAAGLLATAVPFALFRRRRPRRVRQHAQCP